MGDIMGAGGNREAGDGWAMELAVGLNELLPWGVQHVGLCLWRPVFLIGGPQPFDGVAWSWVFLSSLGFVCITDRPRGRQRLRRGASLPNLPSTPTPTTTFPTFHSVIYGTHPQLWSRIDPLIQLCPLTLLVRRMMMNGWLAHPYLCSTYSGRIPDSVIIQYPFLCRIWPDFSVFWSGTSEINRNFGILRNPLLFLLGPGLMCIV